MRRVWVLGLLAFFALPAAAGGVPKRAPVQAGREQVAVEMTFSADGFRFEFTNGDGGENDVPSLVVGHARQAAWYEGHGEVTGDRVEVKFGKLGEISVGFRRMKGAAAHRPSSGCEAGDGRAHEGVFTGTIRFRGERGYVDAETTRATGTVKVSGGSECARRESDEEKALLAVRRPHHQLSFAALARRAPRDNSTSFLAFFGEHREGMRIVRYSYAAARSSSRFLFDFEKGTASVKPPWPFSGHASFRRGGPGGRNSWSGSLRVRMLGIDPVRLAGRDFRAALKPELPYDE
jgi:hypothetical protein